MAQYDGRILIDTAIDASGFDQDTGKMQKAVKSLTSKVDTLGPSFKKALTGNKSSVSAFQAKAESLQDTVKRLNDEMKHLGITKIPTDAYKSLYAEWDKAGNELQKLLDKREKLDERGNLMGSTKYQGTNAYKNLIADIELASEKEDELYAKLQQMEQTGTAWQSGADTAEYQQMAAAIERASEALQGMQQEVEAATQPAEELASTWSRIADAARSAGSRIVGIFKGALSAVKNVFSGLVSAAKKAVSSIVSAFKKVTKSITDAAKAVGKKLISALKSAGSAAKQMFGFNKNLSSSIKDVTRTVKKLVPALLAARGVMGILRKAVNAYMDANESVSSRLSACWSSLGNILGPIIERIVNLVSMAISYITAFLNLFTGGGGKTISRSPGKALVQLGETTQQQTQIIREYGKEASQTFETIGEEAAASVKPIASVSEMAQSSEDGLAALGDKAFSTADEVHQIGEAAEDSKKKIQNLSGLDQMNIWKSPDEDSSSAGAGGGGGGGGVGVPPVELPSVTLPDWAKLFAEQIKNQDWAAAGSTLAAAFNGMVQKMLDDDGWFQNLAVKLGEKIGGAIKVAAQFIREADFIGFFEAVFKALTNALDKIDPADLGTLLASKFMLVISALRGVLNTDFIPKVTDTLVGAINSIFTSVRDKFSRGGSNGWEFSGETVGNFIMSLVDSVGKFLRNIDWSEILADIKAFWNGLKEALTGENARTTWSDMFASLRRAIAEIAMSLDSWIPQTSAFGRFWNELRSALERGDNIEWGTVFEALGAFVTDLVSWLIDHIPSSSQVVGFFTRIFNQLKAGGNAEHWEDIFGKLKNTLETLVVKLVQWIPKSSKMSTLWSNLETRLKTSNDVKWGEIFQTLFDTIVELPGELKKRIAPDGWGDFWAELKDNIANALGADDWTSLTESLKSKFNEIIDDLLSFLYEKLSESHPWIAKWLFPKTALIDRATEDFKSTLENASAEIAAQHLENYVIGKQLTEEEAKDIAASFGYAYEDGTMTSIPLVEKASEEMASTPAEVIQSCQATYLAIIKTCGAAAGQAYLDGLVEKEVITQEEARNIVERCALSAEAASGEYIDRFISSGAESAQGYLDGLVSKNLLTEEQANQIVSEYAMHLAEVSGTYLSTFQSIGGEGAQAYLDGLVADGTLTQDAANQIIAAVTDYLNGDGYNSLYSSGENGIYGMLSGMLSKKGDVKEAAEALMAAANDSSVAARILAASGAIYDATEASMSETPSAISAKKGDIQTAADETFGSVPDAAEEELGNLESVVDEGMGQATEAGRRQTGILRDRVTTDYHVMREDAASSTSSMEQDTTSSFESMASSASKTSENIRSSMDNVWKAVKSTTQSTASAMRSDVQQGFNAIKTSVTTVCNGIKATMASSWNAMKATVSSACNAMKTTATSAWNSMRTTATSSWNAIKSAITTAANAGNTAATNAFNSMNRAATNAFNAISRAATSAFQAVSSTITNSMAAAQRTLSSTFSSMQATVSNAVSNIRSSVNTLSSVGSSAATWGAHVAINFASGINNYAWQARNAAASLAQSVKSVLGFSEPETGPLSDFHTYMPDMISLMVSGIRSNQSRAIAAVSDMAQLMRNEIQAESFSVQIDKVSATGTEAALAQFGDRITANFAGLLEELKTIAESVTFKLPTVATAGVVPYSVRMESAKDNYTGKSEESAKLDRLLSLLENMTASGQSQPVEVRLRVEADSKGIFRVVKAEGKAERNLTGRNPFMLGS